MTWTVILLLLFGFWVSSNFYSLFRNYLTARKTGLPLLICPINQYNPVWMVSSVPLNPLYKRLLPSWIYEGIDVASYGFEFRVKGSIFKKYGPAFILVTPGGNELSTIDPELITEALKRPKDFPNTDMGEVIMNVFGPNLLTSNGEPWSRQRKLIAPNINEKISKLVFSESCRQAREMLGSYMDDFKGVTNDSMQGMKTIAINVLGAAGFGISRPWKEQEASRPEGRRFTYMEATKIVVENILAAVFPTKLLTLRVLPKSWQDIGRAKNEFPPLTKEMLEHERKLQTTTSEPRSNLMSTLVRLSDTGDAKSSQYLSEEEMLGNLFIFTAAGFDTTANTMAYALALLATYPKWQDWLYEEISTVVGDKPIEDLEYSGIFPRLPRCLALMFETVRLFPPLVHIAKQVNKTHDVTVTTSLGTYVLPKRTSVYISSVALHRNPQTYGDDADQFRPDRWLIDPTLSPDSPLSTIANVKTMPKGTFVPWSAGPRACPGMKMSQVEFVSVFMTIFETHRCEAVRLRNDETDEQVKSRFDAVMEDSGPRLTLQMNRGQDLKIKWIKRRRSNGSQRL